MMNKGLELSDACDRVHSRTIAIVQKISRFFGRAGAENQANWLALAGQRKNPNRAKYDFYR
jgi:hypothetical protein